MRLLLCGLAALLISAAASSAADAGGFGVGRAVCVGGNCGTRVSVDVGFPVFSRNVVVQSVPIVEQRVLADVPVRNQISVRRGLFGRIIIRSRGCR